MGHCSTKQQLRCIERVEGLHATVFLIGYKDENNNLIFTDYIFCQKGTKWEDVQKNKLTLSCKCNHARCICYLPETK